MCFICLCNLPKQIKEPHHRLVADVGTALRPFFADVSCKEVMRLPPCEIGRFNVRALPAMAHQWQQRQQRQRQLPTQYTV